ncbi:hypothetical protein AeNC1_009057 [Aphanomyces euteiches]|nr:hypothetical protein AeNC1_009057 [Aphanomyces euteiches]
MPKQQWHWQCRQKTRMAASVNLISWVESPQLRKLQSRKAFDAWLVTKCTKKQKADDGGHEETNSVDDLANNRFRAWCRKKAKTTPVKPVQEPPLTVRYPPFKPRLEHKYSVKKTTKTSKKPKAVTTATRKEDKAAEKAYQAWLARKKAESRVKSRMAKTSRKEIEKARLQEHVDKWRRQSVVMLAYSTRGQERPQQGRTQKDI